MNLDLSKEQFETLLKMVYAANRIINGAKEPDNRVKSYDDLESFILGSAKDFGAEKLTEYDDELKKIVPSLGVLQDNDINQGVEMFVQANFWDLLTTLLSQRDFVKEYGDSVNAMGQEERMEKLFKIMEKYSSEFGANGIESLEIKSKLII
jgi:hypothetical protein